MAAPSIVKDTKYPKMYRIKWEDGSVSDMANLSRIKDALRRDQETQRRKSNDLPRDNTVLVRRTG